MGADYCINKTEVIDMGTYTTETIVIKNPSPKLLDLIERMRDHKRQLREEMRNVEPLFSIHG